MGTVAEPKTTGTEAAVMAVVEHAPEHAPEQDLSTEWIEPTLDYVWLSHHRDGHPIGVVLHLGPRDWRTRGRHFTWCNMLWDVTALTEVEIEVDDEGLLTLPAPPCGMCLRTSKAVLAGLREQVSHYAG